MRRLAIGRARWKRSGRRHAAGTREAGLSGIRTSRSCGTIPNIGTSLTWRAGARIDAYISRRRDTMGNNLVVTVKLDNDRHVCNPMDMVVLPGDTVIWRWTGAGKLEVSFPADTPFDQPGPLAQDVPATVKKDAKPGKHKTETKIG